MDHSSQRSSSADWMLFVFPFLLFELYMWTAPPRRSSGIDLRSLIFTSSVCLSYHLSVVILIKYFHISMGIMHKIGHFMAIFDH